jgi:hypothetical protein
MINQNTARIAPPRINQRTFPIVVIKTSFF